MNCKFSKRIIKIEVALNIIALPKDVKKKTNAVSKNLIWCCENQVNI